MMTQVRQSVAIRAHPRVKRRRDVISVALVVGVACPHTFIAYDKQLLTQYNQTSLQTVEITRPLINEVKRQEK